MHNFSFCQKAYSMKKTKVSERVFAKWGGSVSAATPFIFSKDKTDGKTHPAVCALMKRERVVFRTQEWFNKRKLAISATDFNTLVHKLDIRGKNRYRSVKKLTIQKLGLGKRISNAACDHGTFYESEALRVYAQVTGNVLLEEEIGFCRGAPLDHCQEDYILPDFVGATPDGVCKEKPVLVEIKCPFYKSTIEGGIPDLYWPQIQCQMAVTGIHTVHFVRYIVPTMTNLGEINIIEAKFDQPWWQIAVAEAISFHATLCKIRNGELPVPTLPIPRRHKKKSPVEEVQWPPVKRCKLLHVAASVPKNTLSQSTTPTVC